MNKKEMRQRIESLERSIMALQFEIEIQKQKDLVKEAHVSGELSVLKYRIDESLNSTTKSAVSAVRSSL